MQNVREGLDAEHINVEDCSKFVRSLKSWKERDVIESIRDRFVTGDWSKAALRNKVSEFSPEDDDAVFGDFEDLETGDKYGNDEMEDSDKKQMPREDDAVIEERRLKKLALRAKFDAQYPFTFAYNCVIN